MLHYFWLLVFVGMEQIGDLSTRGGRVLKKMKGIIIWLAVILFLAGIIPIIINEAYRYGALHGGYITMWDAADMLSYYGTILGAVVTIIVLALTISFTRKQICRESYIQSESEKWSKIESVFADALNEINPMRPLIETIDTGFIDPSAAITAIQKYQISCRIATDPLNACLSSVDCPKVKIIIDKIIEASNKFVQICHEEVEAYAKLRDLLHRDTAKQTIEMEAKCPNSFSTETLALCEGTLSRTNGLQQKDIQDIINQLNGKMVAAYDDTYRPLLQLKGATFEQIDKDVQDKAELILHI